MLRLLGMLAAAAAAKSKCKEFKCYGKKEAAPKTPYFAPSDDGLCPEGVAAELGPCCLARDACTSVCGATEDMCAAEFRKCAEVACDAVDDVDDMDKCKEDGALGADSPSMRNAEITNGRVAMVAITAFAYEEAITKAPIFPLNLMQ